MIRLNVGMLTCEVDILYGAHFPLQPFGLEWLEESTHGYPHFRQLQKVGHSFRTNTVWVQSGSQFSSILCPLSLVLHFRGHVGLSDEKLADLLDRLNAV
jgi:hypothetical protein